MSQSETHVGLTRTFLVLPVVNTDTSFVVLDHMTEDAEPIIIAYDNGDFDSAERITNGFDDWDEVNELAQELAVQNIRANYKESEHD